MALSTHDLTLLPSPSYNSNHMLGNDTAAAVVAGEPKIEDRCGICGNQAGNKRFAAREMMYGTGEEFTYFDCAGCGCMQLMNVPEDLSPYYPSHYYSFDVNPDTWRPAPAWRASLKRHHASYRLGGSDPIGWLASKRFPHWSIPEWLRYVEIDRDAPILDVGTGSGGALHALAELGYTNLTGADPFVSKELHYSNGVTVYKRYISEMEGPYKVLLASHVFEHMPDPEENLRQFARVVEPGSAMVISIPVSGSDLWSRYGINWVALDAPRHLFLHSEQSMALLAERVGLSVERVVYNTVAWNFTASEGYVRGIPLSKQKTEDYLTPAEIAQFKKLAADVNARGRGDQATFYLRKPA